MADYSCRQADTVLHITDKEGNAAAKAANPNAVLLINDFNLSDRYAQLIRDLLDAGVPISAIGLQTHQHQGYMPPEIVDLNDYQIPEWLTTPEGEERQAHEMEEMYRFLFAHPLVEAITG